MLRRIGSSGRGTQPGQGDGAAKQQQADHGDDQRQHGNAEADHAHRREHHPDDAHRARDSAGDDKSEGALLA